MEGPQAKLVYLNGRGRGEVLRYVMSAAGIVFTETFLSTAKDLKDVRETKRLMFGQVPLVEIDGLAITQTEAIIRYIARKYNLYGTTENDRIRCDMILDAIKDTEIGNSGVSFIFRDEEQRQELRSNMVAKAKKYFPMFEGLLSSHSYFLGAQMSFVDVVFLHDLEWFVDILGVDALEPYPIIAAFRQRMMTVPNIAAYLASPQKKPFPDSAYVSVVRHVFYS